MVKGLELAEHYYTVYGTRMIQEKFSQHKDRIAAGLVGDGSDCYGFDDEISQDHDWGPSFCLWLNKKDYAEIGSALQREYESLPEQFNGFKRLTSQWGGGRVGVSEIGAFYSKFTGRPDTPKTLEQWLYLPEDYLSTCTNGKVFVDPLGEFSKIRKELLEFYPEDVRLVKVAARCMSCAQSGQYNYMRSIRHKENFAALFSEIKFCSDIMSLVFLLNKQYAPFYKWRHRAVRSLAILGEFLYQKVTALISASDFQKKNDIIEEVSGAVIKEFHRAGLSDSTSNFLLDHGPIIHQQVKDENLKKRSVWLG